KDPPFSKVDLISCRNLLIYMDGDLQQRLMPLYHYALNPSGYLFLGSSETVGDSADLFAPVDKKWKLFQRRDSVTPHQALSTTMPPREHPAGVRGHVALAPVPLRVRVRELAEKTLLDKHAPACAVINAEGDLLYIHGHTGRYLELAPGEPSGSIYKMAREGLRLELTTGVRKSVMQNEPIRYERLRVRTNGDVSLVNLIIEPMSGPDPVKGVTLVIFEDVPASEEVLNAAALEPVADREQRIADLDRELSAKEEYLRTAVEELETSNEELKSTNEEMQSTNEELQSTNEELETSREELQSVNEELVTVNSELQQKIMELSNANNDMNNMLAGTGIGTLFVDQQQLIQRFTPRVTEIMNLIPTDIGRPLGDIAPRVEGEIDLVGAVTAVLDTLATVEAEVTAGGRDYQMRAQPYRTMDSVIEGAVLTFVDVTEQRKAEKAREEAEVRYTSIFEQSPIAIEFYDADGRLISVNSACLDLFGIKDADAVAGFKLFDDPNVSGEIKARLQRRQSVRYEAGFDFEEVKQLGLYETYRTGTMILDTTITPVISGDAVTGYIAQIRDITERKRLAAELAETAATVAVAGEFAQSVLDTMLEPQLVLDGELKVVTANKSFVAAFQEPRDQIVG
ncbi:MAG: PAS domain-containing protein, partial [Actinomycetes bacterium]